MSYGDMQRGSSPVRFLPILLALIAAGVMVIRGCDRGPFNRSRVVGMSPAEENQLGAQAFQQVLQESRSDIVPPGPALKAVQRIAQRIAAASAREDVADALGIRPREFEWEFRLVRSNQVNAFCLPGGKVVVYTGILPVAENEAGLATVLGHEIGHALARHSAERMAQEKLVRLGQSAVASSLGDLSPAQQRQVMAVLGAGSNVGILLPFSRKHESEADHIGLILMAAAGYDPAEAPRFWERMSHVGGSRQPEFMSTHPGPEHRLHDLQGWLNEALPFYRNSQKQDGLRQLPRR
jgi:predicted Zn-dependent protease